MEKTNLRGKKTVNAHEFENNISETTAIKFRGEQAVIHHDKKPLTDGQKLVEFCDRMMGK